MVQIPALARQPRLQPIPVSNSALVGVLVQRHQQEFFRPHGLVWVFAKVGIPNNFSNSLVRIKI
jgi:hypothetical protein